MTSRVGRFALTCALLTAATLTVREVRWRAEATRRASKETSESFLLPPADELRRASLGYRSALADYLWADVLVTQGLRLGERRRYETITNYLDAITSLDPDFREPYLHADSLVSMQAKAATQDDIRAARVILERGAQHFPNDAEMWLTLGQFVTWLAPSSFLTDPEEQQRWRLEGAAHLARAAELGSGDANIAWRAIGGARQFIDTGQRDATIRFYRRALAVTEDEELRGNLLQLLGALEGERAAEAHRARRTRFQETWRGHYPAWTLTGVLASAPPFEPAACAGGASSPNVDAVECAKTWSTWAARVDARIQDELLAAAPSSGMPRQEGGRQP